MTLRSMKVARPKLGSIGVGRTRTKIAVTSGYAGIVGRGLYKLEVPMPAQTEWRGVHTPHARSLLVSLVIAASEAREEGWDGYGGRAVSREVAKAVGRLINLLPVDLPEPDIVPTAAGELAFDWDLARDWTLSASVNADGRIAFAGIFGTARVRGSESFDKALDKELPPLLAAALRRLHDRPAQPG